MKRLKSITITLLLLSTVAIITSQKSNKDLSFKLSTGYENLNLEEAVTNFGMKLIENGILEKSDLTNPSIIYKKLEAVYQDLSPSDYDISEFIEKSPLTRLLKTENILETSQSEQTQLALFTYYQLISENYLNFTFHLDERRLVQYNNKDLPINSLESVIFEEIEKRREHNVNVDNARMILSADEYTDLEFVYFITGKFREMGLRHITYKRKGAN